jgi:hypothetical protein
MQDRLLDVTNAFQPSSKNDHDLASFGLDSPTAHDAGTDRRLLRLQRSVGALARCSDCA